MKKNFKLGVDEIKPIIVEGMGACVASDMITVQGKPVHFMYRENPDNQIDSGWRFMSGYESDEYMDNPENHAIFDVNTIANYDPSIVPFLGAQVGLVFEKVPGTKDFVLVENWRQP